jgi:hypothetical protein
VHDVQGTGLSDATEVHGEYIFPVVQMVNGYTGLTMGNHDIGIISGPRSTTRTSV